MKRSQIFRVCSHVGAAVLVVSLLTQCKTTASYKDIEYDPGKLKTPSGHGLEKKDYPFDDDGSYRKDWVKNDTGGRTRSSYNSPEPATAVASAESGSTPSAYPTYAQASAEREAGNTASMAVPASMTSSEPPSVSVSPTQYHKVAVGDTLFALSKRYNTSVEELQRVNGLTDNTIHVGQSLRVP